MFFAPKTLDKLLKEGFTKKFAIRYLDEINSEDKFKYDPRFFSWAHDHGFLANHAICLGLHDDNIEHYLSDYEYYRTWPHDSWLKQWHNDKLTVKYILNSTEYGHYMPKYYFYSLPKRDEKKCELRRLIDCPVQGQSIQDFLAVLREKKTFACKPNNGGRCIGFYKISYDVSGKYFLNGEAVDEKEIEEFVKNNANYIYTEYIVSGGGLERIHPLIHTLRLFILNPDGITPTLIGSYLRFPSESTGEANFLPSLEGDKYLYLCKVDIKDGSYGEGIQWYSDKAIRSDVYPTNGVEAKGVIPFWDEIVKDSMSMSKLFFGSEILGFDFGITPNGPKMMEINTMPGTAYLQYWYPLMDNPAFKDYIEKKIDNINRMPIEERLIRNTYTY